MFGISTRETPRMAVGNNMFFFGNLASANFNWHWTFLPLAWWVPTSKHARHAPPRTQREVRAGMTTPGLVDWWCLSWVQDIYIYIAYNIPWYPFYQRPGLVLGRQGPQRSRKSTKFSPWQCHGFPRCVHLQSWKGKVIYFLKWLDHSVPSGGPSHPPLSGICHSHVAA